MNKRLGFLGKVEGAKGPGAQSGLAPESTRPTEDAYVPRQLVARQSSESNLIPDDPTEHATVVRQPNADESLKS